MAVWTREDFHSKSVYDERELVEDNGVEEERREGKGSKVLRMHNK